MVVKVNGCKEMDCTRVSEKYISSAIVSRCDHASLVHVCVLRAFNGDNLSKMANLNHHEGTAMRSIQKRTSFLGNVCLLTLTMRMCYIHCRGLPGVFRLIYRLFCASERSRFFFIASFDEWPGEYMLAKRCSSLPSRSHHPVPSNLKPTSRYINHFEAARSVNPATR